MDGGKELADPWARPVTDSVWNRRHAINGADSGGRTSIRGLVTTDSKLLPRKSPIPPGLQSAVIYELHVGGFTQHPSSCAQQPGKFLGLIEKIPYLKDLGITHVELLPVAAFDDQDVPPSVDARGLRNHWGYSPHSFYSPHPHYCVTPELGTHQNEFRELVKALHAAGLGVILDVVFNHTAEGGADGPIINFKGLANNVFYLLDPADRRQYRDFAGCGNTINCNHPIVTRFIVNCLEWWVEQMGVDGFRFDLASVFVRGEDGAPLANPPLPWNIELSRTLARDNELSWFDWSMVETERDMLEFVRGMIALRRRHPSLVRNAFFTGKPIPGRDIPDIACHGIRLNEPAWHDNTTQFLAFTIAGLTANEEDLHVILNMADMAVDAPLPVIPDRDWYPAVDTSNHATTGILLRENQRPVLTTMSQVQPHSVVVFEGRVTSSQAHEKRVNKVLLGPGCSQVTSPCFRNQTAP